MPKKPEVITVPDVKITVHLRPETTDALRIIAREETQRRRATLPPKGRVTSAQIIRELCDARAKNKVILA